MKKKIFSFILVFISASLLSAMPPHPDVVQEYKEKGNLSLLSSKVVMEKALGKNVSSKSFPLTGTRKVLVLLSGFSDLDLHDGTGISGFNGSTPTFYEDLFENDPLNWKEYYQDMSNNQLILNFDIYDAGQASGTHSSYGGNATATPGDDTDPRGFVTDIVSAFVTAQDATIDFNQYDGDGDGEVDTVIIIHAGPGEEVSGTSADMWSHQWSISSGPTADGVTFSNYAMHPEYVESPGDSTIGVFVHEFGHVLGLPDLYDTGSASDGIGLWGVMAAGSWAGPEGKGSQPVPLSAWSRFYLGWLNLETVSPARVVAFAGFPWTDIMRNTLILSLLSALILLLLDKLKILKKQKFLFIPAMAIFAILFSTCGQNGSLIRESLADVETSYTGKAIDLTTSEFIIVENKVAINDTWTEYLPGSGLVLYHIDNNLISSRWNNNEINDYSINNKLGIKVIEADSYNNLLNPGDSDYGSWTDPFYRGNVDSLSDYSSNNIDISLFEINNISSSGPTMTFDVYLY